MTMPAADRRRGMRRGTHERNGSNVTPLGFRLARTEGSRRTFRHADISELLNLQEVGGDAKPYQLRQLLRLVERYNLQLKKDDPSLEHSTEEAGDDTVMMKDVRGPHHRF